jgi:hypothetical protein
VNIHARIVAFLKEGIPAPADYVFINFPSRKCAGEYTRHLAFVLAPEFDHE